MAVVINGNGLITVDGTSTTQGRVRLAEDTDNGTNYIELTAPASVASNRTVTLPDNTGTMLTNASVGTVIQVVSAGTTTGVTVSNQTETDTGVTATITPTSASNKILVLVTMMGVFKSSGNADNRVHLLLKRGTTTINNVGAVFATGTALNQRGGISISKLDSPATTSATTYKVTFYNDENAAEVSVQRDSNSGESTITLMEIAA